MVASNKGSSVVCEVASNYKIGEVATALVGIVASWQWAVDIEVANDGVAQKNRGGGGDR